MNFFRNRRRLSRILLIVYCGYILFTLPFSLIQLDKQGAGRDEEVWLGGGVIVFLAITLSFWGMLQHLINYSEPNLQRYIIRILLMVPIYAVNGWFALRYQYAAIYLDTLRESYEAFVIYFFVVFLLNYINNKNPDLEVTLRNKGPTKHIVPLCCLPAMDLDISFINKCKYGALQYTAVRILTTIAAFICEMNGVYHEAAFDLNSAWIYLATINCISHIVAMHSLGQLYSAMKNELEGISPFFKFSCIYFVVFFSFWQSVLLICLGKLKWIPHDGQWGFNFTVEEMVTGTQDLLICLEMLVAAGLHLYAFSHDAFIRPSHEHDRWFAVLRRTWNYLTNGNDNELTRILDERDSTHSNYDTLENEEADRTEQIPV